MVHSVVVGGTKGLGRVVARMLAARGDKVSVLGRSEMSKSDLSLGNIISYQADITKKNEVDKIIMQSVASSGPINYCIFLQRYRGQEDPWHGEIETTLTATKNIVEIVVPQMTKHEDNAFLMVSSVFAKYIGEGQSLSYHVAKAALDQLMRFYALNLGVHGIRCNAVTPFTFLKEESKQFYMDNEEISGLYKKIIPLRRMGTTEDSANTISYLCSPAASFLTGQNLTVDGGLSLVWPETLARQLMNI